MSTRCQIGIYDESEAKTHEPDALLYKHSDGYEEGTLPILKEFHKKFRESRGFFDAEYFAARLIQHLTNDADYADSMTGYGISKSLHADIEYYYAVYPDRIEMYETGGLLGATDEDDFKEFNLIKTVKV